jgi:formylglycine-generating enzyme required for sulfatase activity
MLVLAVIPSEARNDGREGMTDTLELATHTISIFNHNFFNSKQNKMMKNLLVSFFTLLLFAAATTTATAQAKPKLAVFVVGIDDWKRGDVVAHIVGEELNRDKTYQVVTRSGAVQTKLKALRRSSESVKVCDLHEWCKVHGIEHACLITTTDDQNFSAQLLDMSSMSDTMVIRSGSSIAEGLGAVDLKLLAWSLTGQLRSSCTYSYGCYTEPSIGLDMVYVGGGTFTMGCVSGRDDIGGTCYDSEKPVHDVVLSGFWIGKYEITRGQWEAVMKTPASGQYSDYPVVNVSCQDAYAFCKALSDSTGKTYRLPTEAEWEYAARGGSSCSSKGYMYSGSNNGDEVSWFRTGSNCDGKTTYAVGTKQGNELDIFDMSGNAYEWLGSLYGSYSTTRYKELAPSTNNSARVLRGGSICHPLWSGRVVSRHSESISKKWGVWASAWFRFCLNLLVGYQSLRVS